MGGAADRNANKIYNQNIEWDVKTGSLMYKSPMPFSQQEFAIFCTENLQIYCIGGLVNWNDNSSRPLNAVYDILSDTWNMVPTIDFNSDQFPGLFYQRFSIVMIEQRYLLAFWLKITPQKSYYAKLDTYNMSKGWTAEYFINKGSDLYGISEEINLKATNELCIPLKAKRQILLTGGWRNDLEQDQYFVSFKIVNLKNNTVSSLRETYANHS